MNKKIILVSFLFICGVVLSAQDGAALVSKIEKMGSARIEYKMIGKNIKGDTVFRQSGVIEIQGINYRLNAKGIEIYCNGKNRWIYSNDNEELVITDNDMSSSDPTENPLLFLYSSDVSENVSGNTVIKFKTDDGSVYNVEILKMQKEEPWSLSHFVFDTSLCSDNVIITDLRK